MDLSVAYGVLGLEFGCGQKAVKKRYRRLARALHPDFHPDLGAGPFQRLSEAYRVVCDALVQGLQSHEPVERQYKRPPGRRAVPLSDLLCRLGYRVLEMAKIIQPAAAQVARLKDDDTHHYAPYIHPLLRDVWQFVDHDFFPYRLRERYIRWAQRRLVTALSTVWDDVERILTPDQVAEEVTQQVIREVVRKIPFTRLYERKPGDWWVEIDPIVGDIDPYIDGTVRQEWGWDASSSWLFDRILNYLELANARAISRYRHALARGLHDWMVQTETFKDFLRTIGESTRSIPVHAIAPRESYNSLAAGS